MQHDAGETTPGSAVPVPGHIVVIGASLGGLRAVGTVLSQLSPTFGLPLVIAQHRHKDSDGALRTALQSQSALPVVEAEDKHPLQGGVVYLAPADYHVLVEPGRLALSTDTPVHYARPSIDVLFESAADAYTVNAIGVILTGASADGAHGLWQIKQRGGKAIVQDPSTAECRVMPDAALERVVPDVVSPLAEVAMVLTQLDAAMVQIKS